MFGSLMHLACAESIPACCEPQSRTSWSFVWLVDFAPDRRLLHADVVEYRIKSIVIERRSSVLSSCFMQSKWQRSIALIGNVF